MKFRSCPERGNQIVYLSIYFSLIMFLINPAEMYSQEKQLAQTPPMGWMTWNMFGPEISEDLIVEMADAMIGSGMADAGYEYIIIDDLWQGERDKNGILQPDQDKFPNGMKAVADSIHARGLKLGIYSDAAHKTCGGAAASYGYETVDARTFAEWGIDYLKYDYCHAPSHKDSAIVRYKRMADALKITGRDIVFAICEWGQREPWTWGAEIGGHLWRTTWDIRDTWFSNIYDSGHGGILNILDQQPELEKYSGPGRWNDPDMLVIGLNGKGRSSSHGGAKGCSIEEYRSQMSLWCLINAPLIASCDLRNMDDVIKKILTNREAIEINQDPLGKQAYRIFASNKIEYWLKPLSDGSVAIGVLNRHTQAAEIILRWKDANLQDRQLVRDLWQHRSLGVFTNELKIVIPAHGVRLFKFTSGQ